MCHKLSFGLNEEECFINWRARYIWYLVPGTQVPRYKHQVPRYLRGVRLYLESLPEARDGGGESSLMRDEYLLEKLGCHLNTKIKWCVIICAQ